MSDVLETPTPPESHELPTLSVKDHIGQFRPGDLRPESSSATDDLAAVLEPPAESPKTGAAAPRHRAQSQKAAPDDVQAIAALTRELREAEAELGKVKPDALTSDAPRIRTLKRQIAAVKAELDAAKPAPLPAPKPQPVQSPIAPPTFTEQEPTIEHFANEADPYSSWMMAKWSYMQRLQAAQAQFQQYQQQEQANRQQVEADIAADIQATQQRVQVFAATHPDYYDKLRTLTAGYPQIPELLGRALAKSDKSPDLMYYFADHPDEFADHVYDAMGKPFDDRAAAILQRRLHARLQAESTGAAEAPPPAFVIAPRPPTPVRTRPMSAVPELPGEGHSVADHVRVWGRKID